jgi:hypothetical protein
MVDSSTVALAAGGLVAAEATGVTNLTGGGGGGGGGGAVPSIPPGLVSALDSAAGAAGTLPSFDLSIPGTGGTSAGRVVEEVVREVPTADEVTGQVPTLDTDPLPFAGIREFTRGGDTTGSGLDTSTSDEFDLQDLAGTGDVGTGIASTAEALAEGGDVVEGAVGTAADNPIATGGVAAGVAAAPFTGGLSVPAALGATGIGAQAATDADVSVPDVPDVPDVSLDAPDVSVDTPDVSVDTPDLSVPDLSVPDVSVPDVSVPTGGDGADPSTAPGRGPVDDGPERSEEKQERTKEDPTGGVDLSGIGAGGGY